MLVKILFGQKVWENRLPAVLNFKFDSPTAEFPKTQAFVVKFSVTRTVRPTRKKSNRPRVLTRLRRNRQQTKPAVGRGAECVITTRPTRVNYFIFLYLSLCLSLSHYFIFFVIFAFCISHSALARIAYYSRNARRVVIPTGSSGDL